MTCTVTWRGSMTAISSIAHTGESRATITLLRRELVVQPDGTVADVPLVSGNSLRGRLRRIGEGLLRDALGYEGKLPLAAAHALRGGGALAKTAGEPLSGARLTALRELIPQIGVFGCAAGGRIIDGCLQVGKLLPVVAETAHLFGKDPEGLGAAFDATQLETYRRADDSLRAGFAGLLGDGAAAEESDRASQLMQFRVETFPAGTVFDSWLRLERASPAEVGFFADVLAEFARAGRLGGRLAAGHGLVRVDLESDMDLAVAAGTWRKQLVGRRAEAMEALRGLT